jgi:hypothetical protein
MNLSKLLVVCAVALGGLAVGCGNKCKSLCDDEKKCADASDTVKNQDCDKQCDDLDKLSDAAKCNSQKDDLLDCEDGVKDKCSSTDMSCNDKSTAFGACVLTYCTAHPDDSNCKTFGASS